MRTRTAMSPSAAERRLALLRLCHLVSPALPVGAYAYSQGLEYAVEAGWVVDEPSMSAWLRGVAGHAVGTLDLPVLARLERAWAEGDLAAVQRWNDLLIAARETAELRAEERHLGRALARVLIEFEFAEARSLLAGDTAFATGFALAAARWGIAPDEALCGYLWAWCENQVLAAIKLIPLGQSAGLRILHGASRALPAVVEAASCLDDEAIGVSAAMPVLASALHESQYTRLFRS